MTKGYGNRKKWPWGRYILMYWHGWRSCFWGWVVALLSARNQTLQTRDVSMLGPEERSVFKLCQVNPLAHHSCYYCPTWKEGKWRNWCPLLPKNHFGQRSYKKRKNNTKLFDLCSSEELSDLAHSSESPETISSTGEQSGGLSEQRAISWSCVAWVRSTHEMGILFMEAQATLSLVTAPED